MELCGREAVGRRRPPRHHPASTRWAAMVSYSTTTAIVYALSGFTFFFLIFLLIMVGLDCCAK